MAEGIGQVGRNRHAWQEPLGDSSSKHGLVLLAVRFSLNRAPSTGEGAVQRVRPEALLSQVEDVAAGRVARAATGRNGSAAVNIDESNRGSEERMEASDDTLKLMEKVWAHMQQEHAEDQDEVRRHLEYIENCTMVMSSDSGLIHVKDQLASQAGEAWRGCVGEEECKHRYTEYKTAACDVEQEMELLCSTYQSCHDREMGRYVDIEAKVRQSEKARNVQATALEIIECLIKQVLLVDIAELAEHGEDRIAACTGLGGDNRTARFAIEYSTPPNRTACPVEEAVVMREGLECGLAPTTTAQIAATAMSATAPSRSTREDVADYQ